MTSGPGDDHRRGLFASNALPLTLLAVCASAYTIVNLQRLAAFRPLDFDLAIFGQGVWLLSRGETPFVTVRGLHLFGDHASYVHFLLAPLYRVLSPLLGVRLLVLVHAAALALTGFLLHRLARQQAGARAALLVLGAYLLYPPLQYIWLEYYHPVTLALPALVVAYTAIAKGRAVQAVLAGAFALICVENVALMVAALGAWALARGERKIGLLLIGLSAVYLVVVMAVIFPWLGGYIYGPRLYGDFAPDLPSAVQHLLRPDRLLERLARPANGQYLLALLLPVGFLPLLAPIPLALAVQLPLNMISSWPYAQEIRYHYVALVVPFVFLAVIRLFARLPSPSRSRRLAAAALVVGVVSGEALFLPPVLKPRFWPATDEHTREVEALLNRIPAAASLSVHYQFLPHLCDRRRLYMFPELGLSGSWPDGLLIDQGVLDTSPEATHVFSHAQVQGRYQAVARTSHGVVLWWREGVSLPPAPAAPSPSASPRPPPVPRPAAPTPGTWRH